MILVVFVDIFVVTAMPSDVSAARQVIAAAGFSIKTVADVPTDSPWVDALARELEACAAVVAVPFGPGMPAMLRVLGSAARLHKAVIILMPPGGDANKLPFSMRGVPVISMAGECTVVASQVRESLDDLCARQATIRTRSNETTSRGPFTSEPTLPMMLNATGALTEYISRLVRRTPPPAFEAPYRTSSFPEGLVNGHGTLRFTVDDLAHDLLTTGRAPGDRIRYGGASTWEWLHRASLIPAYIRRHYSGRLVKSRLALELDRSELVAFSYALGQAMTTVFCRSELSVTHLMHVDRYANHYGLAFGATRKRADLFGLAPTGWVVAEAKGRSRAFDMALLRTLRNQKRSITTIGGVRPWLALGCITSFPEDSLRVDAVDPTADMAEPYSIPATLDGFMTAYYAPFVQAIDAGQPVVRDDMTVAARFPTFGVVVRMFVDIYIRMQQALGGLPGGLHEDLQPMLSEAQSRPLDLSADGTAVETEWEDMLGRPDWTG